MEDVSHAFDDGVGVDGIHRETDVRVDGRETAKGIVRWRRVSTLGCKKLKTPYNSYLKMDLDAIAIIGIKCEIHWEIFLNLAYILRHSGSLKT